MKRFFSLIVVLACLNSFSAQAYQIEQFTDPYYELVNAEFDKEKAYKTIEFVESHFRVVGNEGFNQGIQWVEMNLQKAGFVPERLAKEDQRLIYRLEEKPLRNNTWQPYNASLKLGDEELLNFSTNRNMIAINSYPTDGEQEYEVVYVGAGRNLNLDQDLKGKVVFAERSVGSLFAIVVDKYGAAGVIGYSLPSYTKPEVNVNSIQFSAIPRDSVNKSFGLLLSYQAKEKLKAAIAAGNNKIKINLDTKVYKSTELTVVAELRGSELPDERFVFSAHVQEPGANDNASGVGVLLEAAETSARLLEAGKIDPKRTITYLFGDEITSTRRFIQEDPERAKGIKWGMSLDMVGEDTEKTGGTFLIEKMPDPGAIWIRGVEKHTEWGGRPLQKKDLKPHYFNDLTIGVFESIGEKKDWKVNFNPFEGGSDHVPFLSANIPGLLLWHFTDQFYHTDQDRLDKVSKETLHNVGTGALMIALMLTENKPMLANRVLLAASTAATYRLQDELRLSKEALSNGGDREKEVDILSTWSDYYRQVFDTVNDLDPKGGMFKDNLENTKDALMGFTNLILRQLK
ncbi:M28 family peptidase [Roseivirga sp. E12]|uniref:M28 family peptidase n=1 Tax=Roseivirga sp. E12 TaxID=2819237 RepID=UPI001ABC26E8|nr:M28 family peptidase [Roseivirga sp. E12]MBO3698127.1 M28 family peptidase [Roseivirga sp. E12]